MPPSPDSEAARASTPQRRGPRKNRRAAHRPADLVNSSDAQDSTEPDGSTDDDILELLGTKPLAAPKQTPGLLQLTKTSMEAAKKSMPKQVPRRKPARRDESNPEDTPASSEPEHRDQRSRRGKKGTADPMIATEGGKGAADPRIATEGGKGAAALKLLADEMSGIDTDQSATPNSRSGIDAQLPSDAPSVSQSLPASFFGEAQEGRKDAKQWDVPSSVSGAGGKPLNVSRSARFRVSIASNTKWQQQLQNEMTPSKNPKAGSRRASKAPAKAGGHKRRSSLDDAPVAAIAAAMQAMPPLSGTTAGSASPNKPAFPVSHFDSSIPFHTGYNVHRAPQTPLRANQRTTAVTARDGVIQLPIMGEFPRMNGADAALAMGQASSPGSAPAPAAGAGQAVPKSFYAGPAFHNSPAGRDLPKPDLDDF